MSMQHHTQDQLKELAAEAAAASLEDEMIVGLGSGSTARMAVQAIGKRVKNGLKITGIPTSELTASEATKLGIPLATFADYQQIDVTIDGADEVETGTLNLIKGGGGNHLREKIVANASKRLVIIVDQSKVVRELGTHFKVPVEVAQFGWQATSRILESMQGHPELRKTKSGETMTTDGGNYILDCGFGAIPSAPELAHKLDSIVGVIEHGLFIGMTSHVLIGTDEGVQTLGTR